MITLGDMVIYRLSGADALAINRRRTDGASIAARMKLSPPVWPEGAQAHIGNNVKEGQRFPAIVVQDWAEEHADARTGMPDDPAVNLQVWLDGNDTFWAPSRHEDASKNPAPGTFTRK